VSKAKPHHKNVDGPFYVEEGCCTGCGVPHDEAPALFGWEANHCFVSRQPLCDTELDQMMSAMWAADMACIRYRGSNADIIDRIAEFGLVECCDNAGDNVALPVARNRVGFETNSTNTHVTASLIAASFKEYFSRARSVFEWITLIGSSDADGLYGRSCRITETGENIACVEFSWVKGSCHNGRIVSGSSDDRWVIHLTAFDSETARGAARVIDEWLRGHLRATAIQWWFDDENETARNWRDTPI